MFSQVRLKWIALTLLVAIVPLAARAGLGHRRYGHCGRCARPFAACGCAQPICGLCQMAPANCGCQPPVMQTQLVPQTTTVYRQEQFTTLQPVTRTEIRRQAQLVDVPVTTCKQVTVDEGNYQTVWVPRMTTKMVSETNVQKQVRYQDVSVQVVQQVPVMQSRIVPQQVTSFVPQTVVAAAPTCTHNHAHAAMPSTGLTMSAPSISYEPLPAEEMVASTPIPEAYSPAAAVPDHPVLVETPPGAAAANTLADRSGSSSSNANTNSPWTKVPARQAAQPPVQLQSYEIETRTVSTPPTAAGRAVPSAATVWRAQGAFARSSGY